MTIAINSDCHRAETLGRQMSFGIGTRAALVGPDQVLNTSGIDGAPVCARKRGLGAVSQRNLTDQTRHPPCWYRRQAADDRWSSSVLCDCLHLLSCYFLYLFWALPKRVEALRNWPRRFRSDTRACATSPRTSCRRIVAACCVLRRANAIPVTVKKPGLMRWIYTNPERKEFVSDGLKMYSYIPEDRQVVVSNVPDGQ